ncbi:glycerophosphodiester phosphodiesterase [Salininema proteolyticum]|uniref:Glycerophosphodiester phosphodiesterase n=1 Tax=Salininema proteolyticum TaxID=1607685 RepID=A0ABV8TT37_9ACTN
MSTPLIAAHRGSHETYPEQTIAAFRQALEEDAGGLEFDVRLTADRRLVLHHDRTVKRTSDGSGAVADLTLDQLKALDFAPGGDGSLPEEARRIATVEELFRLVASSGRDVRLYAELKHPSRFGGELEERFLELVREWPNLDIVVMSFSKAALARWHRLEPERPLVWIFEFPYGKVPEGAAAVSGRVDYLESDLEFLEGAKKDGYDVYAWTVNDAERAAVLGEKGVDVVFSDRPGALKKELGGPRPLQ